MSALLEKQDQSFDCQDCQVEGKHSFLKEKDLGGILFICYSNMNCEMPFFVIIMMKMHGLKFQEN